MSRACQSYAGNGTHVLHIDYTIPSHSEVSVDGKRQRIFTYSSAFTFMIYLAIFYFSFNLGVMMSDILTHKIEGYPIDYRDCLIEIFVAFPVVMYVYIATFFE